MIEKEPAGNRPEARLESFLAGGARDLDLAESLVEEALLAGAGEAEVYLKTSATTGIILQEGFATLTGGSERGVALRVFGEGGRFGHAFASWRDPGTGRRLARQALDALSQASDSPGGWPPAPRPEKPLGSVQGVVDPSLLERGPETKRRILETLLGETLGQACAPVLAALRDGISRVVVANSRGLQASFTRTLALLTLTTSDRNGWTLHAERVGCGFPGSELQEAARRLARLAGARAEEPAAPKALVLESSAASCLVRWLERQLPQGAAPEEPGGGFRKIASEAVDLVDDPLLPGGVASTPFDGEGHPTRRRVVVKSGIMMHEGSDPKLGAPSRVPGRMVRPSYRDLPRLGSTNLVLLPGRHSLAEMTHEVESGFLLSALEGDPRGDQVDRAVQWRGAGWEIRRGEAAGECRRILFRASPRELLEGVEEASDKLRFSLLRSTALGAPDLLIRLER